jgi:hypothetical protein
LGYDAASTETTWWNPGATTDSHPNDDVGSVSTTVPVNTAWRVSTTSFQDGTGISSLVCTSCHGIHRQMGDAVNSETMANTPILVNFAAAANTGDVCQACHDDGTFVAEHHPASNPSYATLGNSAGAGNLTCAGGNLLANTCHGGNSPGAAAHNRDSALGLMGGTNLRCVVCHSTNPSTYTTATPYTPSGLGTHYISVNAALAVSNANTDYSMPGVNRSTDPGDTSIRTAGSAGGAGVWLGSGLTSLFGDDNADGVPDNDVLVCESCHRLLPGNVTSDNGTRLMAEAVGSTYEIGDGGAGAAPYVYDATHRYLCAGCHAIPGGTHPLNNADTTRSANALGIPHKNVPVGPYWPAAPANTGFTTTTNSLMNCESCHAAHDANTESASFILDSSVDLGANADPLAIHPVIDYTQFCAVCHGGFN